MPKILENEALALAQGIESLPPDQQVQAADVLRRYREQQHDLGEPDWPSQEQAAQESEGRFRALFDDLKNVDNQSPSFTQGLRFSTDPDADRARVAGTAFLSRVYQKQPEEVSRMFPLLRDDYLNKRGQKTGLDDRAFYSFAQGEVKRMTAREKAALEGAKAALRGEDSGKALAAWQAANPDFGKEDSGFFSSGFNKAMEEDGDSLPVAANLLSLLESGSFKSKDGKAVSTPFTDEQAAQLGGMVEQLAGMKPRQRKSIYRAMNARIEAAGYDQKGFWAQMLSELDRGLYRASTTLGTQAGVLGDVMEAQANASQRSVDFSMDGGGGISTPVLSVDEQQQLQRQRDFREQVGNVQAELQDIVSGRLDPVKPTVSWLNDTLETGMIKGPGAVAPFMAASAALGPWGAGILFTADFAEQNRRDLVGMGMDADQARQIGALAAPAQAAVESLSNLFQLGRFPAVSAALARFTKPVGGASLVGRYVQNSLLAGVTEFTEEQIQDNFIVPASQELLAALNSDMPDVDWSFYKERAIQATPELAATLLPMALVFGGVMTAADAKLSAQMTGNIDALTALNFSQAQATEIVSQKTTEERIAKAASLWRSRAGNKASLEEGAKNLSAKLRELSSDTLKHQQELERRGILPRMLHAQDDSWLLTYNDGSTASFATHGEASKARWNWAEDQLGRMHALTREALTSMERNMSAGRELAVEFKPDARTAQDVVNEGAGMDQVLRRVEQGKALGDVPVEESFDNASAFDQATQDAEGFLSSLQILGSSRNEFKDGILRTTIKLWEGSNVLTLVEEKLEGDAKAILQSSTGRAWMLGVLRNYEQESGDKLFRDVADTGITNDDLAEAWSHLGQSYLVGRSSFGEPLQQNNMRRFSKLLMRAGLAGAINAESTFWQAVVNRAQKLGELKKAGKLGEDLAAELERQLGIDSQVVHEQGAIKEAQQVAQDVAQQVDTSDYSEANPGPNGETFSVGDGFGFENVDFAPRQAPRYLHATNLDSGNPLGLVVAARFPSGRLKIGKPGQIHASLGLSSQDEYELGFVTKDGRFIDREKGSKMWLDAMIERDKQRGLSSRAIPADASKVVQMPDGARLVGPTTFSIAEYAGNHRPNNEGPRAFDLLEGGISPADLYEHPEWYSAMEPKVIRETMAQLRKVKGDPKAKLTIYRAGPKGEMNTGDWVSLSKEYARTHAESQDPEGFKVWQAQVAADSVRWSLDDLAEFGYFGEQVAAFDTGETFSIRAYHGTPHKVDKFSTAKIGTGEGAQAYGWGLYFAEDKTTGSFYRDKLSAMKGDLLIDGKPYNGRRDQLENDIDMLIADAWHDMKHDVKRKAVLLRELRNRSRGAFKEWKQRFKDAIEKAKSDAVQISGTDGNLYTVELLPDESDFLDWDKPLSEQSEKVQKGIRELLDIYKDVAPNDFKNYLDGAPAASWYVQFMPSGSPEGVSRDLAAVGIKGIRYLDGGSRGAGDGTRNYVIFDENLIRILEENGKPVAQETFSLRPGDFASRVEAMFSPFQRSPEARLVMARVAKDRALRLGNELIDKANVIRTIGSIDREARVRAVLAEDKAVQDYLDSLTPAARQTLEWEPSDLKDDPLVSTMLDYGKLMSKTTAVQRDKVDLKMGDFDGAPWLPPSFYSKGSGIMPDQMAQAMFDAGLLPDAYTDTLWAELGKRIEASRKDKTAHREAVQAFKDAKKAASQKATQEAQAWADNAKKQAGSGKAQRDRIQAWLRVLDGILAAVPAKLRDRVGGYVKMAGIATDEAALRYLEDRVAKLNTELEKFLIKDGREQLERIFDKSRPKTEAGEKAKGKLTPEAHAWFNLAEQAAKLSPAVADERIEGIEKSLSEEMSAAVKQELSDWLGRPVTDDAEAQEWQEQRLTIFQTFGSVLYGTDSKAARNAAETTAAFELARKVYQDGRLANLEETAKRREKRAADRAYGISRVGSPYDPNKANARKKALNKASGLKGRIVDYLDTGLDPSGFFLDLLGHGDLYETTRRNILEAKMSEDDAMRKRKADFAAMLQKVFPGKSLVARLRGLWELQNIQEGTPVGSMSQLQAVQLTLWWMDLDSREWLESNGYGQVWQAQAESWLTSEARAVRSWLLKQYEDQYNYINPVFRRLRGVNLPRVDVYGGKRQVEHSKSDSSVSLEMDQMRGGMEAGFTKTRVARPSGPPKMTDALQNYWQNAFQVEHYVAFAETITELKAVFGHRDFRLAVETNRGQDKASQVSDIIKNLEQAGTRDAFAHTAQGKLFGRYGKAVSATALLFKLSVIAKQAPAMIQSMFKVGFKEYMTSLGRILSGKGAIALGDMYRSDTVQRRLSDHDGEMAQAAKGWNQRHFENEIIDKAAIAPDLVMNAGWYAIGWTDARFTTVSAAVAYDVAFRNAKSLGMPDDEAKAYAKDEADLIVMETAQPQGVATKSLFENQAPSSLLRLLFAFQSANRQAFGLAWLAAKTSKKDTANALFTAALISAIAQTAGGLMRMLTTDDEPEDIFTPEAYLLGMSTATLTGIPLMGPVIEFITALGGVEARTAVNPAAAAAKSLSDLLDGKADSKDISTIMNTVGLALGGRGASIGVGWNVLNQLMGLYESATDQ